MQLWLIVFLYEFTYLSRDWRIFLEQENQHLKIQFGSGFPTVAAFSSGLSHLFFRTVLVCLGCYNKIPQNAWIIYNRQLFLIVLEALKSKIGVPTHLGSAQSPLLDCRLQTAHRVFTWWMSELALWSFSSKSINPIWGLPLWPNQRPQLLIPST